MALDCSQDLFAHWFYVLVPLLSDLAIPTCGKLSWPALWSTFGCMKKIVFDWSIGCFISVLKICTQNYYANRQRFSRFNSIASLSWFCDKNYFRKNEERRVTNLKTVVMRMFAFVNTRDLAELLRTVFHRTEPHEAMLQRIRSLLVPLEVTNYILFLHTNLKTAEIR